MSTRSIRLALLALAACLALVAAPPALGARLKGIDVSNHQGKIKWAAVPDRQDFAFLKASEGTGFVDVWYERNRRLATRNGKHVGAYHFARPGGTTRPTARADGRAEARFFHAIASPRSGELRPVLDLEVTEGLPPGLLKPWAKAFVRTTQRLVGAKPMIYTSPFFWRTAMDDTRWFAKRGYEAIWIAHWEVRRPDVPAKNWAGEGWTFWQHTDCGRVKGISGCVDKNHYNGTDYAPVEIP